MCAILNPENDESDESFEDKVQRLEVNHQQLTQKHEKLIADSRELIEQKDIIISALREQRIAATERANLLETQLHDARNAVVGAQLDREAWRKRAIAAEIVGDSALLLDRIEKLTKERDAYRASRVELREALRVLVDTATDTGKLLDVEVMSSDVQKAG